MQLRNESPIPEYRQRCYTCFRPVATCFCDAIPCIHNRTHILILQHVKERFHPFNTARIVRRALQNSTLIVDQTTRLATIDLPFLERTGVLYPGPESQLLSDLPETDLPDQLVILDGTWHHAKTLMKQIPSIRDLPKYRLSPATQSNYRIRKEPAEYAVSTLEAAVEALRKLEPDTGGTDQLLRAFDQMIDSQLQQSGHSSRLRRPRRAWRPPANVPSAIIDNPDNIVVAYGEAACGEHGLRTRHREPVSWVAMRPQTGDWFECFIQPQRPLTADFLSHLELSDSDFAAAKSPEQFQSRWMNFIRPNDTMVVFNESTRRLLSAVRADVTPTVTLKSVNLHQGCRTLDEILAVLDLKPPRVPQKGRAGKRLANAIAFTRYLSKLGRSQPADSMAKSS